MLKRTTLLALLLASFGIGASAAPMKTVLQEDFDRYGFDKGCYSQDVDFWEFPPSLKTLYFHPTKMSKVRKTDFVISEKDRSAEMTLAFTFKFVNDSKRQMNICFSLTDENGKDSNFTIVMKDGCSTISGNLDTSIVRPIYRHPRIATVEPFLFNLEQKAMLQIRGTHLDFLVERGGKMVRDISAELPKGFFSKFNFMADSPVALDHIVVRSAVGSTTPKASNNFAVTAVKRDYKLDWTATSEYHVTVEGGIYPTTFSVAALAAGQEKPLYSLTFDSVAREATKVTLGEKTVTKDGKETKVKGNVSTKVLLEDSGYSIYGSYRGLLNTRPVMSWRTEDYENPGIIANWNRYPAASVSPVKITFKKAANDKQVTVFLNGNYIGVIPGDVIADTVQVKLPAGALSTCQAGGKDCPEQFLPLDIERTARIASFARPYGPFEKYLVHQPKPTDFITINGVPFRHSKFAYDLSLCEEHLGTVALECDGFLETGPFEALPGHYIMQIPNKPYWRAYALCTIDNMGDLDQVPVITLHLTEVSGQGRSEAMCEVRMVVDEKNPAVKKVFETGKKSVYMVEFKFDAGFISDLLFDLNLGKLNIDVLGELYDKDTYYIQKTMKPSAEVKSSVKVLALTLEESPAYFKVKQGRVSNTYYPNEKPGITVTGVQKDGVKANYAVTVFDITGKEIQKDAWTGTGAETVREIPFTAKDYGWYGVKIVQTDVATGEIIMKQDSAFALLAPDTRKAGYNSPFYVWNFNGSHGTPRDSEVWGDLITRMGARCSGGFKSEKDVAKWGLTLAEFNTPRIEGKTPEEREADAKKKITDLVQRYPHCKIAMIFHESGGGPFPMEFIGKEPTNDPGCANMVQTAKTQAQWWRKYAPGVKIQIGNTGYSLGCIGRLFRSKFPADLIDYMGEESVGMSTPPEMSVAAPNWALQKMADIFGYKNVRPNACYEWKSRVNRHFSPVKLADFACRDVIIGLTWEQAIVPLMGLSKMANSYYNTIWGYASFTRWPILNPEPAFVSTAVSTRLLDCVKFSKILDTGSNTVYVVEFKKDKGYVYVLWTARGEQAIAAKDGKFNGKLTDMFGKTVTVNAATVELCESPCYLETTAPLKGVAVSGERRFTRPEEYAKIPAKTMANLTAADVKFVGGEDARMDFPGFDQPHMTIRQPGNFTVKDVKDEKLGDCIEITLDATKSKVANEMTLEYGFFKLAKPIPLDGTPNTVFMTVKGNSTWGKVYWELEDADGEKWFSTDTAGYGCAVYDWPAQVALNFDGWNRLAFPLAKESPVTVNSPGDNEWQWTHSGTGDHKVTYPVKITGFGISTTRKTLVLRDMRDAVPSIRIKSIGGN